MKLSSVINKLDTFAPPAIAEFDYTGFLVHSAEKKIAKIGITLDPTLMTIQEAIDEKCDLLITHHGPDEKTFNNKSALDRKRVALAKKYSLPIYRMHLNLDFCPKGNSEILAKLLGFSNVKGRPIAYKEFALNPVGIHVATGNFTLENILSRVKKLHPHSLRVIPSSKKRFKTVAIAPGQGFIPEFFEQIPKLDVYISGELNHISIVRAIDLDICLIEATHMATENEPLKVIANHLEKMLKLPVVYIESDDNMQVIPLHANL